jgi:ATP-dependent RNA helicase RhlE
MQFSDLRLIEPILRAVTEEGYETPTPIQQQAIPHVLTGRDLLGCAQTGTGKTAAFALPMLQLLSAAPPSRDKRRPIRALILTPTRELAAQIGESFATYGRHLRVRHTVIFGGVGQSGQERALAAGPDVLIATPGRLLDLAQQGLVSFRDLSIFVLDEADRMLDMGFIHDVRRVIALIPEKRQTLFFSATMPPEIQDLSNRILKDPAKVAVTPIASTAERIDQHVFFVNQSDKRALLQHVLGDPAIERVLVFTRTKHGANRVAEHLEKARVGAAAIHGNKSQNARERALAGFKQGTTRVLVATDIAARGIDVDGVTHVINFDLPDVPESYVHRIGRTARAGASGIAYSFCDAEERGMLWAIERLIQKRISVVEDHPLRVSPRAASAPPPAEARHDPRPAPRRDHTPRPQGHAPRRDHAPRPPQHAPRAEARGQHAQHPARRDAWRPHEARIPGDTQQAPQANGQEPRPASPTPNGNRSFGGRPKRRYVNY